MQDDLDFALRDSMICALFQNCSLRPEGIVHGYDRILINVTGWITDRLFQ